MKTIDKMILKGFVAPFIATFFIALFVLTMQFLWLWVDDLVGKGVGIFIILELLFYLLISFIPIALPIAILLSSVMQIGGYAERYELSSLTSSGVPLLRTMRPLIILSILISVLSFLCSNFVWPVANLKYRSRLLDIKNQKPTLSIQKGVFNRDFSGYVIRVKDKDADDRTVRGVMIYENKVQSDKINLLLAEKGEMYTEPNSNLFIMKMYNGHQYQEGNKPSGQPNAYPIIRNDFKEYTKVFDMSQFDFNRTDENLYKTHQSMMSVRQLNLALDSIRLKINNTVRAVTNEMTESYKPRLKSKDNVSDAVTSSIGNLDTSGTKLTDQNKPNLTKSFNFPKNKLNIEKPITAIPPKPELPQITDIKLMLESNTDGKRFGSLLKERFRSPVYNQATTNVRNANNAIMLHTQLYQSEEESRIRHVFEKHTKFALSIICIVFLFIGAPMGAIVRKGGFGYPLLVAILFYMIYQILTTAMKKSANSGVIDAALAPWIGVIIMAIIGFYLTMKAMNDSKLNLDGFISFLNKSYLWISEKLYLILEKFYKLTGKVID